MLPVDCIMDQIAKYSVGKTDESNTLFILYAGANDAYFSLEEGGTPAEVLVDLKECVEMLRKIGERPTSFPVSRSPADRFHCSSCRRRVHRHSDAAAARRQLPLLRSSRASPLPLLG